MAGPAPAVQTARADDALVVSLNAGGLAAATELHAELDDAAAAGERRIVVDLGGSPPLDVEIVGVLLASLRRLNDAHGHLVLLAAADDALDVTGDAVAMHDFFRVERTLPAAIAATAVLPDR
jgi:anti-anti-sigma regulatory factor